jgi:Protein-tyrosine-phosphatase
MLPLKKAKVAFICTHNSCRSQIAEALGKILAEDVFESVSAGTEPKDRINADAVRLMKELYGVHMEQSQHPKLLEELPPVDVVITMGCGVQCPFLPCRYREDWGLVDPTGKSDADFIAVIQQIEANILRLKERIASEQMSGGTAVLHREDK